MCKEIRFIKQISDFNYFELKFALQDAFNRPIDLLEEKAVKNPEKFERDLANCEREHF